MILQILKHTLYFLGLLAFQTAFIDQFNLGNLFHPIVIILSVIVLPVNVTREWLLLIAFFEGLVADSFFNTLGVQTFSLVFIAFLRPFILMFFMDKESMTKNADPGINLMGWQMYLLYAAIMIFIYQLLVSFVEIASFRIFFRVIISVICSSVLTLLLVMLLQFLFRRKEIAE